MDDPASGTPTGNLKDAGRVHALHCPSRPSLPRASPTQKKTPGSPNDWSGCVNLPPSHQQTDTQEEFFQAGGPLGLRGVVPTGYLSVSLSKAVCKSSRHFTRMQSCHKSAQTHPSRAWQVQSFELSLYHKSTFFKLDSVHAFQQKKKPWLYTTESYLYSFSTRSNDFF